MTTSVCPVPAAVQLYSCSASQQEVYSAVYSRQLYTKQGVLVTIREWSGTHIQIVDRKS